MEREYRFRNGMVFVTLPESCDRERLKSVTEDFLKKVINGRARNGNSNKSKFIKKQ